MHFINTVLLMVATVAFSAVAAPVDTTAVAPVSDAEVISEYISLLTKMNNY